MDPIRLDFCVETYPHFQLKSVSQIVEEFQLDDKSLVDVWRGEWKTISINIPITVEKGQLTLLRLRPSMREPLMDCPGIEKELELQSKRPLGTKRAAELVVSPVKKAQRVGLTSTAAGKAHEKSVTPLRSPSPIPQNSSPIHPIESRKIIPLPSHRPSKTTSASHKSKSTSSASTTKATVRTWPIDFYICEIVHGLLTIRTKIDSDPSQTWKDLFPKVFGAKLVKSTFHKYRPMFDQAPDWLKSHLDNKGKVEEAKWPAFQKALRAIGSGCLSEGDLTDSDSSSQEDRNLEEAMAKARRRPVNTSTESDSSKQDSDVITNRHIEEFDQLAKYPSYNVEDPQVDKMVADTNNSIAAAEEAIRDDILSNDDSSVALCCFCDEPLPPVPSDELVDMLEALEDETWPDPSPSNPGHRDADSWRVYYEYCERHNFEVDDLPRAVQECWPRNIDLALLHERILMLRQPLLAVMADIQQHHFFLDAKSLYDSMPSNACGVKGEYAAFTGARSG
jgi:hypothetical protein